MKLATILKSIAAILALQGVSVSLQAGTLVGYKELPRAVTDRITGPVTKFIEAEKSFKILIGGHAAFYTFPKNASSVELKKLLKQSQSGKKEITLVYDAATGDILKIEFID